MYLEHVEYLGVGGDLIRGEVTHPKSAEELPEGRRGSSLLEPLGIKDIIRIYRS